MFSHTHRTMIRQNVWRSFLQKHTCFPMSHTYCFGCYRSRLQTVLGKFRCRDR